jgi:single-strand DNA-binding protein
MMVTNFTMATDEQRKDKNGQKIQRTEWHRIVTFGKLAEICSSYLSKGKLIFIEGRIQTKSWEDKDGNKRTTTEIIANNMQMLDSKGMTKSQDTTEDNQFQQYSGVDQIPEEDVPF